MVKNIVESAGNIPENFNYFLRSKSNFKRRYFVNPSDYRTSYSTKRARILPTRN